MAKGVWWLVTPWLMPERIQFRRNRAAALAREAELGLLKERQRARAERRKRGIPTEAVEVLNLFDDAHLAAVVELPHDLFLWPRVEANEINDKWSAAQYCIDIWRARLDLRERFPAGLTGGRKSAIGNWFQQEGKAELRLSDAALAWILATLDEGLGQRARQFFLSSENLRAALPHGLTPVGMRDLFRWFMRYRAGEQKLRLEEIWWLLLDAAQHPSRELMLAYAFTPAWQQRHPDGLTVFGRELFASWFVSEYGASGDWIDAAQWPDWYEPADQIRASYWARAAWRVAQPQALANEANALALMQWLTSTEAALPEQARNWCRRLDQQEVARQLTKQGVNVIGHFCYPSGLRVSVESLVQAVDTVEVATSLRDVRTDANDDPHHVDFRGFECHDITIIHTQPEPFFDRAYERADVSERAPRTYRIAYWYWEFDSVPDSWCPHAAQVDEVWTATKFIANGLRERLTIPVRTLFCGVKLAPFEIRPLSYFGLDGRFTFLFTFHMVSVMERKNPLGLIRAFRGAFRVDEPVQLVLKTSFGDRHPAQIQELRAAAAGANITIIDAVYSPDEVLSLMDACDAYVSLHRSEGLGLTMAEAMLMGKPVIATNFSGNVDFMDDSNSLLVPYKLVKLGKPIPPYDADLEWAEPSEEHAAQLMRRVYDNQAWARELGARAKASAEANLSLEAAGRRIAARLEEIKTLRRQRSAG